MSLITNTYGALLMGCLTATFLSGMNSLQTILYFRLFPKDSRTVKASVSAVWALDITHTGLVWATLWRYFIVNIGQIPKIDIMPPEIIPGAIIVTTIVTFIVHIFYIQRIFRLSYRNYWISIPILFLALGRVGGAMTTAGVMYPAGRFSVFAASRSEWVLSVGLVLAAVTDVAIMVAMFALLKLNREKSISLDNVIDKLIRYTLEMGTVTALAVLASVIAWFALPHTLIFLGCYVCVEKLYAISFMGSLITRHHHLRQGNDSQNSQVWKTSRGAHLVNMNQDSSVQMKSELPLQDIQVDVSQSIQYDDKASSRF
ncbi:hypothetical protein M378DRAFT_164622 [Amanita muscaria Koide BX008]|uniref:DUF6534 domain-containing protein n=1 Tax=Amanita muscaria (strain Koide BX008) TaxID=946122 RepID=A0A0C2T9G3_AMAMK|nr:hypothetical protein M378DRAFT_164622 [Amanita muscaria Koide BX008]